MAVYNNRKRKYRKSGKRVARKSYARKGRSVASVKKIVKRMLSANIETKCFQFLGTGHDILPSNSPGFDGQIIAVSPAATYLAINQGLGQGGRIGNKITIKKLTMDGVMFPLPYNATTNLTPAPIQVKMWIFYDKEEPNAVPAPQASADILQFGSTSLPFQNELFDHTMPINLDRYRVLTTRTYKLGYASYGGTGAQPQQGNFANNDFKLNCRVKVNLTKYAIKKVVYRDNTSNPTTRGLYAMFQPVYANGNPIGSTQIPARLEYMLNVEYEDA